MKKQTIFDIILPWNKAFWKQKYKKILQILKDWILIKTEYYNIQMENNHFNEQKKGEKMIL